VLPLVMALARCARPACCGSGSGSTNTILLMADDQGWGDVGFNPRAARDPSQPAWRANAPRTPNLDAMAGSDSSILFWRFYAGSAAGLLTQGAHGAAPGWRLHLGLLILLSTSD
jgi:hypothetical protein